MAIAKAVEGGHTSSLGFLRPTGSKYCQTDSILQEAISRYKIEGTLLSTEMGISGLQDLYKTTVDRHDELKGLLLDSETSGEPLRRTLAGFFFSFQGIKGCPTHTAAAATMVHAAAFSQGYSLQVRQSLVVGIGLTSKEKEDNASTVAATGKLPVRLLLYNQLEELRNDEWSDLLSIVVALLCFDLNRERQFEKARTALKEARLDNFIKASEALAHVSKLLQDANTAFGKEFITNYDLFQMVRKKLPREVRFEIDSILADGDSQDQLNCDWHYIDDTITKAWLKISRRPIGYYDGIVQLMDPNHPKPSTIPTMHAAIHPSAHDSLLDMTLTCERYNEDGSTCGDTFTFNTAEQLKYKQLGFKNLPKSCMKHRGQKPQDAPRQYANSPCKAGDNCDSSEYLKCREYQADVCKYGDKCKYVHSDKLPDDPTAHNAAISDDINLEDLADSSDDTVYSW